MEVQRYDAHLVAREHQEVHGGLSLRLTSDEDDGKHDRSPIYFLSGHEGDLGPDVAGPSDLPNHRQDANIAALAYRHSLGFPYIYPDNRLSYAGNFLNMMFHPLADTEYRMNKIL